MEIIRLPDTEEMGRLIIRFPAEGVIEVTGSAGSADMALASVVLAKLSVESLERK